MGKGKKLTPKKAPPRRRNTGSADWSGAFLAHLRATANVRASCAKAEVSRPVAYERRKTDDAFAAAWADALEDAIDDLEEIGRDRAKESSDTLLIFFLKSHRRHVYGDKVEVTNKTTLEIVEEIVDPPAPAKDG